MTGAGQGAGRLLDLVLGADPPPFALLYRPDANGPGLLDLFVGTVTEPADLAGIPLAGPTERAGVPAGPTRPGADRHEVFALLPYRQITERGFVAPDDGTPLVAITITAQEVLSVTEVLSRLPDLPITLTGGEFEPSDEEYARTVRQVVTDEIGTGLGANFVIKRSYRAELPGYTPRHGLTLFRRLLLGEAGAYWTFLVHTGDRTLVGATPERHISLRDGRAVMNPISGTYRYGPAGPSLDGVLEFLADQKESDELYMVVDEELKMMARICPGGGRVVGPYLREMARLAHTEYFIEGWTDRDPREILAETMFAPTVTGSPLESACRVIKRYEPEGRGYYSGVAALIGRDDRGGRLLDSAILIRTADIDATGALRIGLGATLVRHSDPLSEVAETRAKAAGLLAALGGEGKARLAEHPDVRQALHERNRHLSRFWLADGQSRADRVGAAAYPERTGRVPADAPRARDGGSAKPGAGFRPDADLRLAGRRVLVVDAEDTFTSMLAQQLRALGLEVTVRRFDEPYDTQPYDLVVMGPGPGDPGDLADRKMAHLHEEVRCLLQQRRRFLAVCLSHQVLSSQLGLPLVRRDKPNQGTQRRIELFGRSELVGFYNTFAANCPTDKVTCDGVGTVEVCRDPGSGEVHALRGPHFTSMQFHVESVLTQDGMRILRDFLGELLA